MQKFDLFYQLDSQSQVVLVIHPFNFSHSYFFHHMEIPVRDTIIPLDPFYYPAKKK